jgi:hypothetical protein
MGRSSATHIAARPMTAAQTGPTRPAAARDPARPFGATALIHAIWTSAPIRHAAVVAIAMTKKPRPGRLMPIAGSSRGAAHT